MGVGALVLRTGGTFYDRVYGFGRAMPWTSAALVIGGLSLIGVPGTAGFISKWVLVQAALEKGWWPLAVLIVLSSLLAVIYVWRMVEALYLSPAKAEVEVKEVSFWMLGPIWIMALACIYVGLATDVTLTAAQSAARGLLAGSVGLH